MISLPKAGIQGASLAVMNRILEPRAAAYIPMFGQRVPLWVAAGVSGALSSVFVDLVHSYILPHIPVLKKYERQESALLAPVLAAGAYIGVWYIAQPAALSRIGIIQLAGEAVASDIGAHYISSMFF